MNTCPYVCNNKTKFGYCKTTVCINPMYNQQSITKWLEKAGYVQVVRCGECKWWFKDENYDGLYRCANDGLLRKEDHYCACGERKNDE